MRRPLLLSILLVLAASTASAQSTWVVDASGAAGSQFTDLPPAVAAAAPGDTILVRAGTYSAFMVEKGLRILADANVWIADAAGAPIVVHDLPIDEAFVFDHCGSPPGGAGRLHLLRNSGAVHLVDSSAPGELVIRGCRSVTIRGGVFGTTVLTDSVIAIASARVHGAGRTGVSAPSITAARTILLVSRSTFEGPTATGGPGSVGTPNGPAIALDLAQMFVSAGSAVHAGRDPLGVGIATSAIVATSSQIDIDPSAVVTGTGGAPPIVSDQAVWRYPVPGLDASSGGPGGTLDAQLLATPGRPALIAVSVPAAPVYLPGLGHVALRPDSLVIPQIGIVPANGVWNMSVPVPNLPLLRGVTLTVQAFVAETAGTTPSTPATVVLH